MNKLILFTAALLVAGQASAYAQGDHVTKHHKHVMSSHAQWRGGEVYSPAPEYAAPSATPYDDDPSAEGRTSGG
jgi:hypothetical protein